MKLRCLQVRFPYQLKQHLSLLRLSAKQLMAKNMHLFIYINVERTIQHAFIFICFLKIQKLSNRLITTVFMKIEIARIVFFSNTITLHITM